MNRLTQWVFLTAKSAAWAPISVFVFHVAVSRVFDTYQSYPLLDVPMHFTGGIAIAFFLLRASKIAVTVGLLGRPAPVTHLVLAFSFTCAAAVFWEFAEFLSDRYLGTYAQLGLNDTLGDMLLGIAGGVCYLFYRALARERSLLSTETPGV